MPKCGTKGENSFAMSENESSEGETSSDYSDDDSSSETSETFEVC